MIEPVRRYGYAWMEITSRCQLECVHCYASSGPRGDHGVMTAADWMTTLGQAAVVGVHSVQFIGGEPTIHPELPALLERAASLGLNIEVYSNLLRVPESLWQALVRSRSKLAISFYSTDVVEHRRITGRDGVSATMANLREAVRRGIHVRAGVVKIIPGQRVVEAATQLREAGAAEVVIDRMRLLGRPAPGANDEFQLCGRCGDGRFAVLPDGSLTPCPLARWKRVGNVLRQPLADALTGMPAPAVSEGNACFPANCLPMNDCAPNMRSRE
ncbi:radical SAM protein [Nonomuraea soli]|uniref:MoaA/NifB/PqqE/SkfB family radical SAM enzyme n=1 Tax=Nonomuraea soli TaxID=1032476 RepID=A0A7W0CGA3_9ACTN|nr:radical SAM protein [Nonomuraea soli]MBA2890420.1 MoaA/NifB/PqqE/SkfB family radical SAM enzyme [Nonomuraea soli]